MGSHHSGILLCRLEYAVVEEEINVCLYAHRVGVAFEYELELGQGSECLRHRIGQDREAALGLLFRLVGGGVTACQFCDVVGDDLFVAL